MRQLTPPMLPMYTVQRCRRKGNALYGPVHYSHDGEWTFCGVQTGPIWWILTNNFDGEATCKKCIAINGRNRCQK